MNAIQGQEIFESGRWNGLDFTDADLDGIVAAFNALKLAGRVPLKFGHTGKDSRTDDSQPSLGWISKIYRQGAKLFADFADVPPEVVAQIKSGAYRFASIELLRGVMAGTRRAPWVLDAVALLGATAPAVGTLSPLKAARAPLNFEDTLSFTRQETEDDMATTEQFAALTKKHIGMLFETAIRDGRVLVRDREMFNRSFPDASAEDAESFIAQTPKPKTPDRGRVVTMSGHGERVSLGSRADHQVMEKVGEFFDEQRAKGKALPEGDFATILAAAKEVFRRNPELAQAWKDAPGEST